MKQIKDYPKYAVTEDGKVYALNYNRTGKCMELKQSLKKNGYYYVQLSKNGESKTLRAHRLIAATFIPNPKNSPQSEPHQW